jgi:hypothetical protein
MTMGSPLWKRGVRGDFVEIFNSIGVINNFRAETRKAQKKEIQLSVTFLALL